MDYIGILEACKILAIIDPLAKQEVLNLATVGVTFVLVLANIPRIRKKPGIARNSSSVDVAEIMFAQIAVKILRLEL